MKPAANGECCRYSYRVHVRRSHHGENVEGLLVVGRRSDDPPGGVTDVAVVLLLVDDFGRAPRSRALDHRKRLQNSSRAPAGDGGRQAFDPPAQVGHRQEALPIVGRASAGPGSPPVRRHRPSLCRARRSRRRGVVGLDLDRQVLAQEGTELCEGDVLGQELNRVAEFGLEYLGDAPGIIDGGAELGDTATIAVDFDDDGVALTEAVHDVHPRSEVERNVPESIEEEVIVT